jgi:hypothetical protein
MVAYRLNLMGARERGPRRPENNPVAQICWHTTMRDRPREALWMT